MSRLLSPRSSENSGMLTASDLLAHERRRHQPMHPPLLLHGDTAGRMAAASPTKRSECRQQGTHFFGASAWRKSIHRVRSRISRDTIARWCCCRGGESRSSSAAANSRALRSIGDWVEFDGATSTRCELLDGPCVDLNLMVPSRCARRARIERLREPTLVAAASPRETTLIFRYSGPIVVGRATRGNPCGWSLGILLS